MDQEAVQEKYRTMQGLYKDGQFAEALSLIEELEPHYPRAKNILYPKAICLEKVGRLDEARALYHQVVVLFDHPRAKERLAELEAEGAPGAAEGAAALSQAAQGPRAPAAAVQPVESYDLDFHIKGNPDIGHMTVVLKSGESVRVEGGAMSMMSGGLTLKTRLMGGLWAAILRRLMGGESLLVAEYSAPNGGWLGISPAQPGTVLHRKIKPGDTFNLTAGSFLACSPNIKLKTRFGGFRALFSREGAFFLEVGGDGDIFYNAYGAIVNHTIEGEFIVDTGHLVAWDPGVSYTISGMGGLKQTLFSGEGLVMRFTGQGAVQMQTRTMPGLAGFVRPYLRV